MSVYVISDLSNIAALAFESELLHNICRSFLAIFGIVIDRHPCQQRGGQRSCCQKEMVDMAASGSLSRQPRTKLYRIPVGIAFPRPLKFSIERFARLEDRTFSGAVVQLCRKALEQLKLESVSAR